MEKEKSKFNPREFNNQLLINTLTKLSKLMFHNQGLIDIINNHPIEDLVIMDKEEFKEFINHLDQAIILLSKKHIEVFEKVIKDKENGTSKEQPKKDI